MLNRSKSMSPNLETARSYFRSFARLFTTSSIKFLNFILTFKYKILMRNLLDEFFSKSIGNTYWAYLFRFDGLARVWNYFCNISFNKIIDGPSTDWVFWYATDDGVFRYTSRWIEWRLFKCNILEIECILIPD